MNYFKPVITNVRKIQGGTIMTLNCKPVSKSGKGVFISVLGRAK